MLPELVQFSSQFVTIIFNHNFSDNLVVAFNLTSDIIELNTPVERLVDDLRRLNRKFKDSDFADFHVQRDFRSGTLFVHKDNALNLVLQLNFETSVRPLYHYKV